MRACRAALGWPMPALCPVNFCRFTPACWVAEKAHKCPLTSPPHLNCPLLVLLQAERGRGAGARHGVCGQPGAGAAAVRPAAHRSVGRPQDLGAAARGHGAHQGTAQLPGQQDHAAAGHARRGARPRPAGRQVRAGPAARTCMCCEPLLCVRPAPCSASYSCHQRPGPSSTCFRFSHAGPACTACTAAATYTTSSCRSAPPTTCTALGARGASGPQCRVGAHGCLPACLAGQLGG